MSRAIFTANRQLFFKGWPPCSECPGSSWLPSRPKGASVCFLHRNRTGSGRPSTALPDQPSVSLPRRHSERRPKSALRMGLTGSPTGTFFYQPTAPSVIKDRVAWADKQLIAISRTISRKFPFACPGCDPVSWCHHQQATPNVESW